MQQTPQRHTNTQLTHGITQNKQAKHKQNTQKANNDDTTNYTHYSNLKKKKGTSVVDTGRGIVATSGLGTQFTRFTSTYVQVLTQ